MTIFSATGKMVKNLNTTFFFSVFNVDLEIQPYDEQCLSSLLILVGWEQDSPNALL